MFTWILSGLIGYVLVRKAFIMEAKSYLYNSDKDYSLKMKDLFIAGFISLWGPILLLLSLIFFLAQVIDIHKNKITPHFKHVSSFLNRKVVFPKLPNVTIQLGNNTNKSQIERIKEDFEYSKKVNGRDY